MKNNTKGYLYAFLTTLSLANVYIFSKAALNHTSLAQFGFYWFGFAILWNLLFSGITGKLKSIKTPNTFQIKNFIGIGLIEVVATVSIFTAIKIIPNPTIPSLIRNLEPVLIVILSILILKEKFNKVEKLGLIVTLIGTICIAYNKNSINDIFINGVEYIVISSIFYSFRTIWSKKVIKHHTPISLSLNKVSFLFITAVIAVIVNKESLSVSNYALYNMLIGSLIGPFFSSFAQFISLKYIDASRSTLIQSSTGFITMILAYLYFGTFPEGYQIFGGIVTIFGLALVTYKSLFKHN